jgi:hypothetical protein
MGQLLVAALAMLWVVFVVSAAGKVAGSERQSAFARSLRALRLVPVSLVGVLAAAVSGVEVLVAFGLTAALWGVLTGAWWAVPAAVVVAVGAVGLLAVLTAGIVLTLNRRITAPCACFGGSDRSLSWRHVLRNGVMLLVAIAGGAIAVASSPPGVDPVAGGLAGAAGVIVAVVLIRLDEIVELFAPAGRTGRAPLRS